MKNKPILTLTFLFALLANSSTSNAQFASFNFDELTIDSGKVINGSDGYKLYQKSTGSITLNMPVYYDTQYKYWSGGWAFSHIYDSLTTTSNYAKQLYASKGFKGYNNSPVFAVGTNGSALDFEFSSGYKTKDKTFELYIANSTYAYNSITFGDAFGKKFGGTTGGDKDFFKLKIEGYTNGTLKDTFVYYLADFTGSNKFKNQGWQKINYSTASDSFVFNLSSSDNGSFGMNTPAYYTIDNISYEILLNAQQTVANNQIKLWPNPAGKFLLINSEAPVLSYTFSTLSGQILNPPAEQLYNQVYLNTENLKPGIYNVKINTHAGSNSAKVVIAH